MDNGLAPENTAVVRASDVATVLGLNPYKTPLELWAEYTGRAERPQFDDPLHPTNIGRLMEEPIAELYSKRTGRRVRRDSRDLWHDKYTWLTGHIDRRVVGEQLGVEIKNVGARAADRWGENGTTVAEHYLPQVMTYMVLTKFPSFDVCAYFGGDDIRLYEVPYDKEWEELIAEATHDFIFNHVLRDDPPPLTEFRDTAKVMARVYPGTSGEVIEHPPEIVESWRAVYEDSTRLANMYASTAANAKAHLLGVMRDASVMVFRDGTRMTRKIVQRSGYTVDPTEYVDVRFIKPKD